MMDEIIAGGQGGRKVSKSAGGSIYDRAPESMGGGITLGEVGGKAEEDDALNALIRAGAAILAVGLLLVFLPSDLTSTAPDRASRELTPEVLEQVKQRAEEYEKQLESTPQDVAALKGAAESYVVLEDYACRASVCSESWTSNPPSRTSVTSRTCGPRRGSRLRRRRRTRTPSRRVVGARPPPALLKGSWTRSIRTDGTA